MSIRPSWWIPMNWRLRQLCRNYKNLFSSILQLTDRQTDRHNNVTILYETELLLKTFENLESRWHTRYVNFWIRCLIMIFELTFCIALKVSLLNLSLSTLSKHLIKAVDIIRCYEIKLYLCSYAQLLVLTNKWSHIDLKAKCPLIGQQENNNWSM